jgi:hypothetical protein
MKRDEYSRGEESAEEVREGLVNDSARLSEEAFRRWERQHGLNRAHRAAERGNSGPQRMARRRFTETAGGHRKQQNGGQNMEH